MPQPGLTYRINTNTGHLSSMIDNKDSIEQAIYKALSTPKYNYLIYSWLYGIDLEQFVGESVSYIRTNIKPYLEDCLLKDDRIQSLQNIQVTQIDTDSCWITFDVVTTEGLIEDIQKELTYGV